MRKSLATLLAGLLFLQPVLASAQKISLPSLLSFTFDGQLEPGVSVVKEDRQTDVKNWTERGQAVKQDPNDQFGVSYRWIPGGRYRAEDVTVTKTYKVTNPDLFKKNRASNAASAAKAGAVTGVWFASVAAGGAAGGLTYFLIRSKVKSPAAGLIAAGVGVAGLLGLGIPWSGSASKSAYNNAYQQAERDADAKIAQGPWSIPTTTRENQVRLEILDPVPPLDSPAHPNQIGDALRREAAWREEQRRRQAEEDARRMAEELRNQWFLVQYGFRLNGSSVISDVKMNGWFLQQLDMVGGYVEVRLYAGDQRGQERRLAKGETLEMKSSRTSFKFNSWEVCNRRNELYPYNRYLKVRVFPRNSSNKTIEQFKDLQGASLKVTCKGALWETFELIEALQGGLED